MAEVPYDPFNPYGPSGGYNDGGYYDPWNFYGSSGEIDDDVDPNQNNPFYRPPTGVYVGNTLTGDLGSNPFGVDFGANGIAPYNGPLGYTEGGTGYTAGHGSLDPNANPTQYGGGGFPNVQFGIPGLNIGTGGLIIGGGIWDILGGGDSGGSSGGQQQTGGTATFPTLPGVYEDSGATVGPGLGGPEQQGTSLTKEDINGPSRDVLFPSVVWDGKMPPTKEDITGPSRDVLFPPVVWDGTIPPTGGGESKPNDTIVPPVIPSNNPTNGPTENQQPNTIYKPLGTVFPPPATGGGGGGGGAETILPRLRQLRQAHHITL